VGSSGVLGAVPISSHQYRQRAAHAVTLHRRAQQGPEGRARA
jgi:hypothetical protein